ncbi:hypothetical protein [Streptomyces chryseus]|uniref:hypothetical protein n=1 Tax=Streptomyces chryseus TaxID=68186 RepID=UPI00110F866D|nr:hypothetical protein [Streptomyces chryseus]
MTDRPLTPTRIIPAGAALPVLGGESLVSAWAATLHDARTTGSVGAGYVIGGVALTLAVLVDRHRPTLPARILLITTVVGGTGALHWFDPITALTGVRP